MLVLCIFSKWFTELLELIQLFKQSSLEKFFIFTIYQHYTLALSLIQSEMKIY